MTSLSEVALQVNIGNSLVNEEVSMREGFLMAGLQEVVRQTSSLGKHSTSRRDALCEGKKSGANFPKIGLVGKCQWDRKYCYKPPKAFRKNRNFLRTTHFTRPRRASGGELQAFDQEHTTPRNEPYKPEEPSSASSLMDVAPRDRT
jgi:hypothetical protein